MYPQANTEYIAKIFPNLSQGSPSPSPPPPSQVYPPIINNTDPDHTNNNGQPLDIGNYFAFLNSNNNNDSSISNSNNNNNNTIGGDVANANAFPHQPVMNIPLHLNQPPHNLPQQVPQRLSSSLEELMTNLATSQQQQQQQQHLVANTGFPTPYPPPTFPPNQYAPLPQPQPLPQFRGTSPSPSPVKGPSPSPSPVTPVTKPKRNTQEGVMLYGKEILYRVPSKKNTSFKRNQLGVTPITLYSSDSTFHLGCQIAVSDNFICYSVKVNMIRVLNRSKASRTLLKGHLHPVTDLQFFHHTHDLLASSSEDGGVFVWKITSIGDALLYP